FIISLGINLLCFVGHQIFQKFYSLFLIWRMLSNGSSTNIHLSAAIFKCWQQNFDALTPALLFVPTFGRTHKSDIVGIRHRNIANTAQNVFGTIAVTAGCFTSKVILNAGEPLFSFIYAIMRNVICK